MNTRILAACVLAAATSAATSAATAQTLDKVKSSGSISVAYRESSIPFSYLDDKAQPTGFGWEICGKIDFFFFTIEGCVDFVIGENAVPVPDPPALARACKVVQLRRRGLGAKAALRPAAEHRAAGQPARSRKR